MLSEELERRIQQLDREIATLRHLQDLWESGWDAIDLDKQVHLAIVKWCSSFWSSLVEEAVRDYETLSDRLEIARRVKAIIPRYMYGMPDPEQKNLVSKWRSYWGRKVLDWMKFKGVMNISFETLLTEYPFSKLCSDDEREAILDYLKEKELVKPTDEEKKTGVVRVLNNQDLSNEVIIWCKKNERYVFNLEVIRRDNKFRGFSLQRLVRLFDFMIEKKLAQWVNKKENMICVLVD